MKCSEVRVDAKKMYKICIAIIGLSPRPTNGRLEPANLGYALILN